MSRVADDDLDDDRRACPKCGDEMEWADCWMIDCEDGWYDMSEEDPINYVPGDMAGCSNCDGEGGWLFCRNCERQAQAEGQHEPAEMADLQ